MNHNQSFADFNMVNNFIQTYNIDCKAGINRYKLKIPATQLHGSINLSSTNKTNELSVFHAVQSFITTIDALKLEMCAVDELHPSINELMDSLNKVNTLPVEHISKEKVKYWLLIVIMVLMELMDLK